MGTRVYIGRLSHHTKERDVEKFFKSYGRIRDIMMKTGYGFVEFDDHRDADDAVYELNGKDLMGERVVVNHARGPRSNDDYRDRRGGGGFRSRGGYSSRGRGSFFDRRQARNDKYGPPTRTGNRVIVENLSSRVSWQDLKDYMRQAGEVTYADAHKKEKNVGVVEFSSAADLKNAMSKLDGTEINGRKIHLIDDSSKRSRSRSRSRSRRRSSSRSRSRSRSRSASRRRSASRSRSRSVSRKRDSRSRSKTPVPQNTKPKSRSRSPGTP
ncbi:hypothetical protein LOTGIDRAFT_223166 [Lottia gigantea]|uniref:RRM domain-containing protein n=1 Tax=Lottia gigantea TaxID=225164 RepID=V3YY17_LOTGI|nr:hypothetical protein LOTGIDRAFT_223166 [Lottia gigantea]ESO83008.1 hypothetical protein LOTGIDRAFT_223166 [Lottia gigantea]